VVELYYITFFEKYHLKFMNTFLSSRYRTYPILVYIIFFAVIFLYGVSIYAGPKKEILQKRKMLTAQLDSIEMEKQIRKRSGQSLEELESESEKIHESLSQLRNELVGGLENDPEFQKGNKSTSLFWSIIHSLYKPSNAFDWVIIVIGFIALLSGIVLIGGMVHSIFSGTKKGPRGSVRVQRKKSDPDRPVSPPASVSKTGGDTENMDITSLRKRMSKDIDHIQRFNKESSPFSAGETEELQKEEDNKDMLRERIIDAAQEGLDAQEISRRYHVSVDQVALILRVAEKGH